ncbi:MAG: hypothetical protein M1150_01525 [Patescibacteria group bacterium]|nr:hypothetical protein [Patescibacteria group bacterium]
MKKFVLGATIIILVVWVGALLAQGHPINTIGPWNEGPSEGSGSDNSQTSKQNLPEPPKQPGQKQESKPEESSPPSSETPPSQPTPVPQSRPVSEPPEASPITQ